MNQNKINFCNSKTLSSLISSNRCMNDSVPECKTYLECVCLMMSLQGISSGDLKIYEVVKGVFFLYLCFGE
jgi:hypothetical protein